MLPPTKNQRHLEDSGTRIANTKHFALTESWDLPADWTADSKAILSRDRRLSRE